MRRARSSEITRTLTFHAAIWTTRSDCTRIFVRTVGTGALYAAMQDMTVPRPTFPWAKARRSRIGGLDMQARNNGRSCERWRAFQTPGNWSCLCRWKIDKESGLLGLKRQAPTSALQPRDSAGRAVAALDAAIWTSIIAFLPMPKSNFNSWDDPKYATTVSEVVATWKTLLNLRLVSKELALLLHPEDNSVLWKKLLLQSFDFSVSKRGFNVEDHGNGLDLCEEEKDAESENETGNDDEQHDGSDSDEEAEEEEEEEEEDPQLVSMPGRYGGEGRPSHFLDEDLILWTKLGICHRPSNGFCRVRVANRLYQNLRQHCQDWRAVCCNKGSDGVTSDSFVGESKSQPHRWIGYVSDKSWP